MKDFVNQLDKETRKVDFDSFDISVKELVSMSDEGMFDIAPEYQRQFRWPEQNQSRLIESVLLGIPVPSLFMAANKDGFGKKAIQETAERTAKKTGRLQCWAF